MAVSRGPKKRSTAYPGKRMLSNVVCERDGLRLRSTTRIYREYRTFEANRSPRQCRKNTNLDQVKNSLLLQIQYAGFTHLGTWHGIFAVDYTYYLRSFTKASPVGCFSIPPLPSSTSQRSRYTF